MPLFIKKPIMVGAIQYMGNNYSEVYEFIFGKSPTHIPTEPRSFYVPSLEGMMAADIGDWVIRGIGGEFYPCKSDIFEKTYEKAVPWTTRGNGQEQTYFPSSQNDDGLVGGNSNT